MRPNSIKEAVSSIKKGEMVIVVDNEERENEGDLVCAAEKITRDQVNFMAKEGRGLICVPISEEIAERLDLKPMVSENTERTGCDFTVSVDLKKGTTTGISASDRFKTIRAIADLKSKKDDFARPGHVFPIRSRKGGVLMRAGHTEASIDLVTMAGLTACSVICEITREDGEMARLPDLVKFAKKHNIKIVSIADLISYRRRNEKLVEKKSESRLLTEYGSFDLLIYRDIIENDEHLVLKKGKLKGSEPVLTRVHSECTLGDVFRSTHCNCRKQIVQSLKLIQKQRKGVFVYVKHSKTHAGLACMDKSSKLKSKSHLREYGIGAQILSDLGVEKIKLLTDSSRKVVGLEGYGLEIKDRISFEITKKHG